MSDGQVSQEELSKMSPEEIAALQKKNCVFCKIVSGEIPSRKVYEDDKIIAVVDIYPSVKGHILVMPKDHFPIMPLIPPDIFKHLFRKVKYLAKGVKGGVPSAMSNIFIANGAAAGQQSPHFLFHIIPRDKEDGLDMLSIPQNGIKQDDIFNMLKANVSKMFITHLEKEGKITPEPPKKEELATILEDNPQIKQAIKENPAKFKTMIQGNPQLEALFQGVDIDKLSWKLRELEAQTNNAPAPQAQPAPVSEQAPASQPAPTPAPEPEPVPVQEPEVQEPEPMPEPEEPESEPEPLEEKEEETEDDESEDLEEEVSKSSLDKIADMFTK